MSIKVIKQKDISRIIINDPKTYNSLSFKNLTDLINVIKKLDKDNKNFTNLEKTQLETVVKIEGKVVARSEDTINKEIGTGEIEVTIDTYEELGSCKELPMPVFSDQEYAEEIRLKYRFLDLRRKKIHENIIL